MTPAGVKPGEIVDDRKGPGSAGGRMIGEDRPADDGSAVVVHVEETISPALAGHEGVVYESPPLPRAEALALVRLLIGRDCQNRRTGLLALPDRGRAAHRQAPARGERRDGRERTPISDRWRAVNDGVRLIVSTDETGLHVDIEQLARAGIKPGSSAVIEIRTYTEEDWVADGERTFQSGKEFLAYLAVCPSHAEE